MMSTKKVTVSIVAVALVGLVIYGISSTINLMDELETHRTELNITSRELQKKNKKLETVEKDNHSKVEKIKKLEKEKKKLQSELHAKREEEKRVASALAVQKVESSASVPEVPATPYEPISTSYLGNGMWCTDYVHSKRPDVPIYSDAGMHWISAAQAEGKSTGSTPRAGAVAVMNGHVAYVEKVNSDGSYVVSEMGWNYQPGNFNRRTVQPGAFGGFIY